MKKLFLLGLLLSSSLATSLRADTSLVFNEIMYHPATNEPAMEWVEFRNQMAVDLDVSDWVISGGIDYKFPAGTVVRGRGYIVVAVSPLSLTAATGVTNVLGPFAGRLGNNGDTLRLRNNSGRVIDEMTYDVEVEWPVAPDGSGASLAKADRDSASAPAANWIASAQLGGTPGADNFPSGLPVNPTLAFNEISGATNAQFFVEIYNHGTTPVALDSYAIVHAGDTNGPFVFSGFSALEPAGRLVLTRNALGFSAPFAGDRLFLLPPARDRVLDAAVVKTSDRARLPEGTGAWLRPSAPTPDAENLFALHSEIVINEIMYNHTPLPSTNGSLPSPSPEAWIELYNRSANTIDLTGWELAGGISYLFTPGQTLAPGAYLVVADDVPYLRALYPSINIVGDFGGKLSGKGDRILLRDPSGNPADEVIYHDRSPWPDYADGGGSSMQLVDARLDNSKPESWAASYEGDKSVWITNSYRMIASIPNGSGQPTVWADFIVGLLGPGECLIDDLSVIEAPSGAATQLISNGSFDSSLLGWRVLGTHGRSQVEPEPGNTGNNVLHLVATGPQEHMHNHIERTLNNQRLPQNNTEYQISYRAKWIAGNNLLNTRLYFNRCARTVALPMPQLNGTPGAPNPTHGRDGIPQFSNLTHQPVVPQPDQAVTVTVNAEHFSGAPNCQLYWSANGGASNAVAMTAIGGGRFSGTIPGQAAGVIVQFWIQGERGGKSAWFPADGPDSGALYAVADGLANLNAGHNVRILLTPANTALLYATTNVMSNDRLPGTLIYDEGRAYYNVGVRLKGSQRGRANTNRISFHLEFPPNDLFRGVHPFMLVDRSGAGDDTNNKQQEILIKHILLRAGDIPGTQPDMCRVITPRTGQTGSALLSPRLEDDFIESAYENSNDGGMWELELIYFLNGGQTNQFGYKFVQQPPPNNDSVAATDITDVGNDKEIYRYNFMIKMGRDVDDYSPFMNFAKAWSLPAGSAALDQQSRNVMDVDEWMRVWALVTLCGVGDTYTYGNNHNLFMYLRPSDRKMLAFPADMDFSFNRGTTAALVGDQNLSKIINLPANLRLFYGHILDIINTSYNTNYMAYWVNHYQSLTLPAQNYSGVISYIQQRATFATTTINGATGTNFTVAGTNFITTSNNLVTLTGTAAAQVRTIKINGIEYPIAWGTNNISTWRLVLPVTEATNVLNIVAEDFHGNPITNFNRTVTVNYTGPVPDPTGAIVINEIMYNPAAPDAAFVEILNTSANISFDIGDWRFNGIDFTFDKGTVITNRGILVLAANLSGYSAAYTNSPAPLGKFDGNLQDDGETLTLLRPNPAGGAEIVMNRVRYEARAPWPVGANGSGPSLQLMDATQDTGRVGNWADREEWRYVAFTGFLQGSASNPALQDTNFSIYLNVTGDVYLDDIQLVLGSVAGVGPNLIQNGDFEAPLDGIWAALGNHSGSVISSAFSHSGGSSLHVIATGPGNPNSGGAAVRQVIPGLTAVSNVATLSFWMIPSTNGGTVSLRARPSAGFQNNVVTLRPVVTGTPGLPNSVAQPISAFPPLWLNEAQPENLAGATDNQGEREPWVELHNAGPVAIPLDGYYLANNYSNLTQWAFPPGATLQPGEFKRVIADGEPGETTASEWHTSFRLDAGNGSVAFVWTTGGRPQVLDYLSYTNVPAGRSYGDFPDAQPFFREVFYRPTPGGTNDNIAPPIVVYINEWMAANTGSLINTNNGNRFDDWIEIYNPGNTPANLAGYYLTDNLANKTQFHIPAGYVVPPQGFLLVWADERPSLNTNTDPALHVSFRLSQGGEQIGLFASDGAAIDTVDFLAEPQFNNRSQGRFPDGTGPSYFLASPTPLAANTTWANRYPVLDPIPEASLLSGETLSFTASATDPDLNTLTYGLAIGSPTGAVINATSGAFTWTPAPAQVPGTNLITVRVTDNGIPALSAAHTFRVVFTAGFRVSGIARQPNGDIQFNIGATVGKTYRVEYKDDLNATEWTQLGSDHIAASNVIPITDVPGANAQRLYRVRQLD